ncbi:MAG: SLC13 family permease [Promethearchaeati archaeon]
MNLPATLLILILFSILMAFFSQDKIDYFPIGLIIGAISVISLLYFNVTREELLSFINFDTLIFIFAMQIIIYYATEDKVLEYLSLRIIHFTKGNNRLFFYLICIFTAFMVAFIEDLSLSLILAPLIFRTCRVLRIPAGTYMMGMTITINIGAILTPISSLKNLIISQEFDWGFGEFIANMGFLFALTLVITLVSLDFFILKKEEQPTERDKKILLSMVKPDIVIEKKRTFLITSIIVLLTFIFMIIGINPALSALFSAALLLLFHAKSSSFSDIKNEISWRIIILFAVLFMLSNSLEIFGFAEFISTNLIELINGNIFLAVLLILTLSSILSAFLAGTPVTIIFLPILSAIVNQGLFPNPLIIAFIGGVNMAGNFLPQGSACDLLTLNIAKKYNVKNLNYRRLLKNGGIFAMIHFTLILVYTLIYTLILG